MKRTVPEGILYGQPQQVIFISGRGNIPASQGVKQQPWRPHGCNLSIHQGRKLQRLIVKGQPCPPGSNFPGDAGDGFRCLDGECQIPLMVCLTAQAEGIQAVPVVCRDFRVKGAALSLQKRFAKGQRLSHLPRLS